ncbi:MAG: hypothetical protein V4563_17805 [Pseudomonadota bacterium]
MKMIYYKTEQDMESAYECPDSEDWDVDTFAASQCADDYHSNHDGWECTWPMEFYLATTEDSKEWKMFLVDREYSAEFHAREAKVLP